METLPLRKERSYLQVDVNLVGLDADTGEVSKVPILLQYPRPGERETLLNPRGCHILLLLQPISLVLRSCSRYCNHGSIFQPGAQVLHSTPE